MPKRCCVPGCKVNYEAELRSTPYRSMFRFPKNEELKTGDFLSLSCAALLAFGGGGPPGPPLSGPPGPGPPAGGHELPPGIGDSPPGPPLPVGPPPGPGPPGPGPPGPPWKPYI
ncbi:unnamed protein product [Acanthoscelides obtectus]|uniref:Uncharacterized protein n=1 Tax=Acanthoscelides obtectus TaxID=200917 RepID=A0A9P0PJQ2_ACAOB|nr:unnamed protein product [Acanthoscelides obtectus]CAK1676641.1 hypothetical protein AOBTE_LOCUS30876 [Acanthoscelides obtectus]